MVVWSCRAGYFPHIYIPDQDYFGLDTFTYRVFDTVTFQSDTGTVAITVYPVNDVPVMTGIENANTAEDEPLTITVFSSDVDTGTGDGDENVPEY